MLGQGGPTCSNLCISFKVRFSILYVQEERHFCPFLSRILKGQEGRNYDKQVLQCVPNIFVEKKGHFN